MRPEGDGIRHAERSASVDFRRSRTRFRSSRRPRAGLVALNREALQAFWSEGNAWLDRNNLGVSRSDIARNNATVPFRTVGRLALVLCVPVARFMHGH